MSSISQLLKENNPHEDILAIAGSLGEKENIPTYIVGGYVRDTLLGKSCKDIDIMVNKKDKIALIGTNGVGKTTLLEILMGNLEADSGKYNWGQTITTAYFPQNTTDLVTGDEVLPQWIQGFDPNGILMIFEKLWDVCFFPEKSRKRR